MAQKKHPGRFAVAALLAFSVTAAPAQATITAMVPGEGVRLKPQLWNLTITSTYAGPMEGQVRLELRNVQTHGTVLTAVSAKFPVQAGARLLQASALQPLQYGFPSGNVPDETPDGLLPVGQYQACYQLYLFPHNQPEVAAEDCAQFQIEPLTPPLLNMPEDSGTVESATPSFTWVPPSPQAMFGNLNYDFVLAEVAVGQSATDAVSKNMPIQQANSLQQPFLQYLIGSRQLERGKLYAWQIIARDGAGYAAKSEAWVFKLKTDSGALAVASTPFVRMKAEGGEIAMAPDGVLKFSYEHRSAGSGVDITIRDITGEQTKQAATFSIQVKQGNNFIQEPIGAHVKVEDGHIYMAELVNSNREHFYLRFRVKMFSSK